MGKRDDYGWSWAIFLNGFWRGFGGTLSVFCVSFVLLALFADTSFASFDSVIIGLVFALIVSAVIGYDAGEDAVREWRNTRPDNETFER